MSPQTLGFLSNNFTFKLHTQMFNADFEKMQKRYSSDFLSASFFSDFL